jgi:hypothetical protein
MLLAEANSQLPRKLAGQIRKALARDQLSELAGQAVTWSSRTSPIKVGDRVAVSARHLRNTGQFTGDICFARGTVTALQPLGEITLAVIQWDPLNGSPPDVPEKFNVKNLSRVTPERGVLDVD